MLDELGRRQAAECGMRAELVVIDAPGLDRGAGMEDGRESVLVEQLVAKASVRADLVDRIAAL
jgi:hypothetical protein